MILKLQNKVKISCKIGQIKAGTAAQLKRLPAASNVDTPRGQGKRYCWPAKKRRNSSLGRNESNKKSAPQQP